MASDRPSIDDLKEFIYEYACSTGDMARAEAARQRLLSALHGKTSPDLIRAAGDLEVLAAGEAMGGAHSVLERDPDGWRRLRASMLYRYWAARILWHHFSQSDRPDKVFHSSLNNAAAGFVHAVVHGDRDVSRWLGHGVAGAFGGRAFGYWTRTPFEPFAACLFRLWDRGAAVGPRPVLPEVEFGSREVYQEVLDAWRPGGAGLGAALVGACEYHVERAAVSVEEDYPEFVGAYTLFPAEILAIQRIRDDLGLETPPVEHPLMATPLAHPPKLIELDRDEILEVLTETLPRVWPNFNGGERTPSGMDGPDNV